MKNSRGVNDNNSKTKRKNVAMACIDNKEASDIARQTWIIGSLKLYRISDEIIEFIKKTMESWRVELTAGGKIFAEVKIQRGIFHTAKIPTEYASESNSSHCWNHRNNPE